MRKTIVLMAVLLLLLPGCSSNYTETHTSVEQPHLYWKDIDVIVTDIAQRHWFATTHWYEVEVTVKCDEYGLSGSSVFHGSGAFGRPPQWNYRQGDTVRAELYSWMTDSTGEVVRREIHQVY